MQPSGLRGNEAETVDGVFKVRKRQCAYRDDRNRKGPSQPRRALLWRSIRFDWHATNAGDPLPPLIRRIIASKITAAGALGERFNFFGRDQLTCFLR